MSGSDKIPTMTEIQEQFRKDYYKFAKELERLTEDLKAVEVITAVGPTTIDLKDEGGEIEVTNIANGGKLVEGKLTILARTRLELDGDLLSILPTKGAVTKALSNKTPSDNEADTELKEPTDDNKMLGIDQDILNIHNENVKMALENIQFVFAKVFEIGSKLAEGGNMGMFNEFKNMFTRK